MSATALPFPLNPPKEWNLEQVRWWWEVIAPCPALLEDTSDASVTLVCGSIGSGVSTALSFLHQREQLLGNLVLFWDPKKDGESSLLHTITRALERELVMSARTTVNSKPIPDPIKSIWFWLATQYCFQNNPTVTRRWFSRYWDIVETVPFEQLRFDVSALPISYIIDFLLDVANAIGYKYIVCLSDNPPDTLMLHRCLNEIAQSPRGLRIVLGLNIASLTTAWADIPYRCLRLIWTWQTLWPICERLVSQAVGSKVEVPVELLPLLQTLMQEELGTTLRGAQVLAATLYWLHQKYGVIPPNIDLLTEDLYTRSIRLQYNPEQKVLYRGIRPLHPLSSAPLQLFEYLYARRGHIVTHRELLENVCIGSAENIYQLVRRIRTTIEPEFSNTYPSRWIYLSNHPTVGFSLQNCL